jgi:hypothetical protein
MRKRAGVTAIIMIALATAAAAQSSNPVSLQCGGSLGADAALRVGAGVLQRFDDGVWGENLCAHPYISCTMQGATFVAEWESGNGQASQQALRLDLSTGAFEWMVGGEIETGRCTAIADPAR